MNLSTSPYSFGQQMSPLMTTASLFTVVPPPAGSSPGVPVPPAPPKPAGESQSSQKWGKEVMSHGQLILPSLLLRAQARLCVTLPEMVILLQIAEHWWRADSQVFPSMRSIAERVDLTPKQIQRHINALVEKGLISKKQRRLPGRGKASNEYDLSGLVRKLKEIEPDFARAREVKRAAAKPGGLLAAAGVRPASPPTSPTRLEDAL